jgi:hypothetical protein
MPKPDPTDPPAPSHPGPYLSTWGPLDGPILRAANPPTLGVMVTGRLFPIGMAFAGGAVAGRRGPICTFRLVVDKVELEGRWICDRQRFVKLGDAAEEL